MIPWIYIIMSYIDVCAWYKGPVTLLHMRETYDKRMKINEIIFICTKLQESLEMPAYEYRTSGLLLAYSACA
jgi:hypothetical protein